MQQEIKFCRSADGVRLAYALAGTGPPLVKAANWLSHIEYEWNSPVWRHWYRTLAENFTLIRYDQRGCGLSDRDVRKITFDTWVRDLEAVVNAAGFDRFPLLGISQGGAVAAAYAAMHPDRVSRLIIYGGYLRGRRKQGLTPEQEEETEMLLRLIRVGWGSETPAFRQVFTSLFLPDANLDQVRSLNHIHKSATSAETAERIVSCFDQIDVRDLASQISSPTLIVHSRDDARVPFEEGRTAAAIIPNARFVPLESRNHILLSTEPAWKKFTESVLAFTLSQNEDVPSKSRFADLTPREKEVMHLVAQGLSNAQIARQLFISAKTVRNHITNIFSKLGIKSRPQAIVMARDAGLGR